MVTSVAITVSSCKLVQLLASCPRFFSYALSALLWELEPYIVSKSGGGYGSHSHGLDDKGEEHQEGLLFESMTKGKFETNSRVRVCLRLQVGECCLIDSSQAHAHSIISS